MYTHIHTPLIRIHNDMHNNAHKSQLHGWAKYLGILIAVGKYCNEHNALYKCDINLNLGGAIALTLSNISTSVEDSAQPKIGGAGIVKLL